MNVARPGTVLATLLSAIVLSGCATPGAPDTAPKVNLGGDGVPVSGTIIDDQQRPVVNATVTLEKPDNAQTKASTQSDASGVFRFESVPAGDWKLRVQALGFHVLEKPVRVESTSTGVLMTVTLREQMSAVPFHLSEPKRTLLIQYGFAWQVGGDFNAGCIYPSVTCNAVSYPSANAMFRALDPKETPFQTLVLEEAWTANSPVCAKAVAIDLYNPDAPSTTFPSFENAHYWTNYPSTKWKTDSPIRMVIPRTEEGNPDALEDPARTEKNGGPLMARGNWTLRNFPPGKGLTNQAVDVNCFTDQKLDIYFSTFYLEAAPKDFSALPV